MLTDINQRSCPISWKSTKERSLARSILAVETFALTNRIDSTFFISHLVQEASLIEPTSHSWFIKTISVSIICFTGIT